MPGDSFSYSRLQTFSQCPAQYRFHYLEHQPESGTSIESFLGNRLHESLEWLYRERLEGRPIPFDGLIQAYRSQWARRWDGQVRIADPAWQTDDYYQLGLRALAGYYRRYAPFDEPVDGTERTLTFDLGDQGDYRMKAILDRLDHHGPGWWSIHDYKSGKRIISEAKAKQDLQMKVYYLAVLKTQARVERVDVVWHFLRHGKDVILEDVAWKPERIADMLKKRIDRIREAEAQPELLRPKESILCNWCYYWAVCPAKVGQSHPARVAR